MHRWLARLRHDLVKHAAFRARDLEAQLEEGRPLRPGDVTGVSRMVRELPDAEGRKVGLLGAWLALRADFDDELPREQADRAGDALGAALDRCEAALREVEARVGAVEGEDEAAARSLCAALRALESAVERLAHDVNEALRA